MSIVYLCVNFNEHFSKKLRALKALKLLKWKLSVHPLISLCKIGSNWSVDQWINAQRTFQPTTEDVPSSGYRYRLYWQLSIFEIASGKVIMLTDFNKIWFCQLRKVMICLGTEHGSFHLIGRSRHVWHLRRDRRCWWYCSLFSTWKVI
jgi:hypothetical protein